jgi:hypothetical protein
MSKAAVIVLMLGIALGVASDRYFAAKRSDKSLALQFGFAPALSIDQTGKLKSKVQTKRKKLDRPPAAIEPQAQLGPSAAPANVIPAGSDCGMAQEGEKIVGFTGYRKSLPQLCPDEKAGTRQYLMDEMKTYVCTNGKLTPVGGSRFKAAGFDDSGCSGPDDDESIGESAALVNDGENSLVN